MMMRSCRDLALVALALALTARTAHADPVLQPAAQAHFDRAMAAYDAKDYETALGELRAAYAIDPRPDLVYAQAQAQRMAGHCADAIETYRRYLALRPPEADAAKAERHIARCGATLPPPESRAVALPPAPPPPVRRDAPPWYRDRLGVALVIGGLASAGIGAGCFVAAANAEADANAAMDYPTFLEHSDRVDSWRLGGTIGVAAGAILTGMGVVRFVF